MQLPLNYDKKLGKITMLHRKTTAPPKNSNKPLWTQEESIAYECAREVINGMVGICSHLIAQEEKKDNPNLERIQQLDTKIAELFKERSTIDLHDKVTIAKIRMEYGSKIRAYRESGKCPA
jgi:hypothetical protein